MAAHFQRGRYEPTDLVVIRAPLLPVERYLELSEHHVGEPLAGFDPLARNAIHAASAALAGALDGPPNRPPAPTARAAALRYLIRMSTRPTPFGLFAGIGLARWGPRTTLQIGSTPRLTRTRPDMGWLAGWVLTLEADPAVRAQTALVANTCAFERDGRVYLSDRGTGARADQSDVSIRATGVVRRALALARQPISRAQLAARLLATTRGADQTRIDSLIDQLCRLDLLLSDLRPPLTADPVGHVDSRLRALPATGPAADRLAQAVAGIRDLDRANKSSTPHYAAAIRETRTQLRALHDVPDADVLQVDSALPLIGRALCGAIAADAARAVDLLLRLHPAPGGPAHLAAYRRDFVARYGHHRPVPLLELLDPRFGLGPPAPGSWAATGAGAYARHRDPLLVELATTALRDGADEIVLEQPILDALATWAPEDDRLLPSLELSLFLLAADPAAIDRGEYRLLVGPNVGAQAAGRGLARFADLLGPQAHTLLRRIARAEEQRHDGGVSAELVYLPVHHRAANVTIRPNVRDREIPVGVTAGVHPDLVIAPDRLSVIVRDDRLRLWCEDPASADGGYEVTVSSLHMLNTTGAPRVCQFLHNVGLDGMTGLSGFDWGAASGLPFLPRVRVGRIVLRPAQWRGRRDRLRQLLRTDDESAFNGAARQWRERWRVPRHVYLAAGDNRLLLDLDDPQQADLLRDDVLRSHGGDLILEECLPAAADAWLPGPGGRYISELVVPMVRRGTTRRSQPNQSSGPAVGDADRLRRPGSDWLYLKLYGPVGGEDDLLRGPVRDLATALVANGDADRWFFLRYADPDRHLRLRLHGDPDRLLAGALPRAMTWAAGLIAAGLRTRVALDTYEREVERYGGVAAMALAEEAFAADSFATATLLGLCGRSDGQPDILDLAVVSFDALLVGLGMDLAGRLDWCSRLAPPPRESGTEFRARKVRLRAMLGGAPEVAVGQAASAVLITLTRSIEPIGARLAALHADLTVSQPVAVIADSLVHLHANRLGLDAGRERLVIGLLRRTLASLVAAPLPGDQR